MKIFYYAIVIGFIVIVAFLFVLYRLRELNREPPALTRPWNIVAKDANFPLGTCTYDEALKRAAMHGRVGYVDHEYGIIFINLPGHSGEPPPGRSPGIQ